MCWAVTMRERVVALDGVRALACAAVIGSHAHVPWATGGWLGVDVFFPLSGFLITQLLLDQRHRNGRIALLDFYRRRLARLYPALLLACGVAALAYLAGVPGDGAGPIRDLTLAATYTGDLWRASGRPGGLLGHTWSLAVEEQFYLAWPLALIALRTKRLLITLAVTTTVVSLAAAGTLTLLQGGMSVTTYFAPQTRIWELMAGCLLALVPLPRVLRGRGASWTASVAAVAVFILTTVTGGQMRLWPMAAMVLAVVVFLASVDSRSGPVRVLASRPLAWCGERSYGLYLYHLLLMQVLWHVVAPEPSPVAAGLAVAATVVVAAASYRFVESPIRERFGRNRSPEPSPVGDAAEVVPVLRAATVPVRARTPCS